MQIFPPKFTIIDFAENEVPLSETTNASPQREYPFEKLTREIKEMKKKDAEKGQLLNQVLEENKQLRSALEETNDRVASVERQLGKVTQFESTMTSIAEGNPYALFWLGVLL